MRSASDRHYKDFAQKYAHARRAHDDVRELLKDIQLPNPKARVLDLGSGGIRETGYLCERVALFVGLDLSPNMIQTAPGFAKSKFVVADFNSPLPFADHTFSHVTAISSIHHAANPIKLLDEISRVVQTRGHIFILTHSPEQVARRSTYQFFPGLSERSSLRFVSIEIIREYLLERGFHSEARLVARKPLRINQTLLDRISTRAFDSAFFALSDVEWKHGLKALRHAVAKGQKLIYTRDRFAVLATR